MVRSFFFILYFCFFARKSCIVFRPSLLFVTLFLSLVSPSTVSFVSRESREQKNPELLKSLLCRVYTQKNSSKFPIKASVVPFVRKKMVFVEKKFLFCFVFREKVVPLHSLSERNMFLLTESEDRSLK